MFEGADVTGSHTRTSRYFTKGLSFASPLEEFAPRVWELEALAHCLRIAILSRTSIAHRSHPSGIVAIALLRIAVGVASAAALAIGQSLLERRERLSSPETGLAASGQSLLDR